MVCLAISLYVCVRCLQSNIIYTSICNIWYEPWYSLENVFLRTFSIHTSNKNPFENRAFSSIFSNSFQFLFVCVCVCDGYYLCASKTIWTVSFFTLLREVKYFGNYIWLSYMEISSMKTWKQKNEFPVCSTMRGRKRHHQHLSRNINQKWFGKRPYASHLNL